LAWSSKICLISLPNSAFDYRSQRSITCVMYETYSSLFTVASFLVRGQTVNDWK
jgi:hypothetical protein